MSGPWHPTGRARVSMRSPRAAGICDSCGFQFQLADLRPQPFYAGPRIQLKSFLKCKTCLDIPNPAVKSITIPPDPLPVLNPRPEQYAVTVPSFVATEDPNFAGSDITTEGGDNVIWEDQSTPLPDPNNPALYPPGESQ
jgi:hypothetical protein